MRNLLLGVALITAPVAVFAAGYSYFRPVVPTVASAPSLGDMTPFEWIATDVQDIAGTGDMAAAELRITDLESAWDEAQPSLRPVNTVAHGAMSTSPLMTR